MLDFSTKLIEFMVKVTFYIKKSHSDTKSTFSVVFIKRIVIILSHFVTKV
jgi:hypothetical protein